VPLTAAIFLDAVEADYRAILYKARWDEAAASDVVPQLMALLDSEDRDTLLRTLRAFVTIGPLALDAAPKITPLLRSPDPLVFQAAAIALAVVSLRKPDAAIKPLIEAADVAGQEKYVMLALIEFGKAAKSANPVFVRAFDHRSASIRRLALRGLAAIESDEKVLSKVLRRAAEDKSKEVREYAAKLLSRRMAR
jgi:HEAT repeat protein